MNKKAYTSILVIWAALVSLPTQSQTFQFSQIRMFWKDGKGQPYNNFGNVLQQNPKLVFLMNGGMFTPDHEPVGLFIENGKVLRETKILKDPSVNFGIQPQGIFAIYKDRADILHVPASTAGFVFATQSAPVLVINGLVNPNLPTGKLIKLNGVGIKKDGTIFFALETMNFNEFAEHFIKNGCVKALYLDGFVSQVWHKGEPMGTRGPFGPMIGAY